jgi:predicted TIM-barrel fold metal-dependent hydrolase
MQMSLNRREILKCASGLAFGQLSFSPLSFAMSSPPFSPEIMRKRQVLLDGYKQAIFQTRAKFDFPIIDIEHHWGGGDRIPIELLIDNMNSNGVALTWLGPSEKHGSASSLEVCSQYPQRLVPTIIHGDGPRWHGHDMSVVKKIDTDARSGEYFAMGEFESRHYYVSIPSNRDIHMPTDSDSFHGIFRASQESGVPFLLHHDAEDVLLPQVEKMLSLYPGAVIVWCHVGRNRDPRTWSQLPTPEGVEKFILKYPNLHFDILQSGAGKIFPPTGAYESVLYYGTKVATLRPEWVKLFNNYADRFLIGSDINTFRWNNYDEVILRLRNSVLRVLTKEAAEKIAFKNAWRLMSGQVWLD